MGTKQIKDFTQKSTSEGTDKILIQESGGTNKFSTVDTIAFYAGKGSTVLKSSSYAITDTDAVYRVEVDTTSGDITITLPLKANNLGRRIEIANVKGGTNKVIINPHATDANKLSGDGLAAIWLPKIGNFVAFQESVNSGFWEIVNERITSQLRLNTYAGYGSTDTKIMRFTNVVENIGNMFSENHVSGYNSNAEGLKITVNRGGWYAYMFSYESGGGAQQNGVTLDVSSTSTAMASVNVTQVLNRTQNTNSYFSPAVHSGTIYLNKNQVLRPQTDGAASGANFLPLFTMSYLGQ